MMASPELNAEEASSASSVPTNGPTGYDLATYPPSPTGLYLLPPTGPRDLFYVLPNPPDNNGSTELWVARASNGWTSPQKIVTALPGNSPNLGPALCGYAIASITNSTSQDLVQVMYTVANPHEVDMTVSVYITYSKDGYSSIQAFGTDLMILNLDPSSVFLVGTNGDLYCVQRQSNGVNLIINVWTNASGYQKRTIFDQYVTLPAGNLYGPQFGTLCLSAISNHNGGWLGGPLYDLYVIATKLDPSTHPYVEVHGLSATTNWQSSIIDSHISQPTVLASGKEWSIIYGPTDPNTIALIDVANTVFAGLWFFTPA